MSNFSAGHDGHDGHEEGMYGYTGAYPFFALGLEGEGESVSTENGDGDGDGDGDLNGNGNVSGNGNRNQMGKARQHVRHISSATTLIVAREEEDEGDQMQVPEKVLIIGKGGYERGEKNDDDDDAELELKRNATGLSMGGLEVLVRDEDIELEGGGLERFGDGDGDGDGNGNGIEEKGERIGKLMRWDEVVNIHSHLIGAVLFALLPIYIYHTLLPRYHDAATADLVVFALFFGGVAVCFGLSFFHQTASFWIELDYLGIVALMWGSTVATIYHGFICDVKLQRIYWSMITLLSLALTLFTLLPPFRTPFFRPYRTLMYAALGLSAVIFIVHSIIIYGISLQYKRLSLGWIVGMAGLNFVGALAYSLRIPEKYFPGRFDIYGNSHQILHCMVVLAALAHFAGLVQSFDYLHSGIEECPVR
ncbi:hypothetical protein BGAL_0003g00540 [Botrytis galanthina]|uniref:HlyIII-domain-containing protein n=1 Tax=Botrytis galanthina TaxID=278940 RepID=A0A4S8REM0_9HELO|nr:hypothetical protein BGAL_0003g00540 [Botrytis galanthina]